MAIVLNNALLVDIDPIRIESGSLRIEGGDVLARNKSPEPGDQLIDCQGAVVLPGLVNGHTHLYSALAVGMPAPPRTPTNFLEILHLIWWRLDQALDDESNEMSATIGALDALHCGTTTLIDHHASPRAIAGSLDAIERGISNVGLRGVLCYEVTDRHGKKGREEGLEESRRYIVKAKANCDGRFAALSGAHASFTLDEMTLQAVAGWADEFNVGVHVHVAEDPCDEAITRQRYHKSLMERLAQFLRYRPIFAHCIHLNDDEIAALNLDQPTIAHNPRSNMNNAVGYAPIAKLKCPIALGTDGIGADMFAEAKAAWFKSRDAAAAISPNRVIEMLATSARRASQSLGVTLGKLQVGAAADIVITDYVPFTPLTADNFAGHFIFAMSAKNVRHVIANGKLALKDRVAQTCDEQAIRDKSRGIAQKLWQRMESIPA